MATADAERVAGNHLGTSSFGSVAGFDGVARPLRAVTDSGTDVSLVAPFLGCRCSLVCEGEASIIGLAILGFLEEGAAVAAGEVH